MATLYPPYRGTRRTQRFARGLVWSVVLGAFAVGSILGAGLWGSMRSDRQTLPLMNIPTELVQTPTHQTIHSPQAPPRAIPAVTRTPTQTQTQTTHTFNGRPLRQVKTLAMKTTAYSPDARSCGKWADGITASGYSVWTNAGKLAAADTTVLPFGTIISIPGYHDGKPVPVLDRGGAIKGQRLDLLYPTHEVALQWGVQNLDVTVWEYAD